jgi:hypothetical protein
MFLYRISKAPAHFQLSDQSDIATAIIVIFYISMEDEYSNIPVRKSSKIDFTESIPKSWTYDEAIRVATELLREKTGIPKRRIR